MSATNSHRHHLLSLAAKRALTLAQMMTDYACVLGHDGTPPDWDKNCARCEWMREQKQALARIGRQIEKQSAKRKRK